jgi:hypothetical protein
LLVPDVAAGSAHLDDELRTACAQVVADLIAAAPDEIVVGAGWEPGEWAGDASWDFVGFGVPRSPRPGLQLPWPLGIGAWLLDQGGWTGGRRYVGVNAESERLAGEARTALLVVGDGSAARSDRAPAYYDPRAEGFDTAIAGHLARGDVAGLGGVDQALAAELGCGGWAAWRWAAATIGDRPVSAAQLAAHVAPYGVGYFVARWVLG